MSLLVTRTFNLQKGRPFCKIRKFIIAGVLPLFNKGVTMAVIKNKTQGRYVNVYKGIVEDKELKLIDRGLLVTMLSLPDQWHFSINGMCAILPDGRDSIQKSLQRLEERGYLSRVQGKDDNGKFGTNIIEVREIPILPCTENPDTVNPDTEKPHTENLQQLINNKYTTKELNKNIYSSKSKKEEKKNGKSSKWTDEEADFYGI